MNNFKGLAELLASLWGDEFTPFIVNNWTINNGVSKAWNTLLLETVDVYDLLVVCNDDITWHGSSFQTLVEGWDDRPDDAIMITGANSPMVDHGFSRSPDYSCFMIDPKQYIKVVGLFDENFTPAYFEDNDSHYRIRLSGYEAYAYNGATITHKGSQTQNADLNNPVVPASMFERNRSYYIEKWGGQPGEEKYRNPYGDTTKDWKYWRDC
jgi:GT2 family glycosyltransferase